MDQFSHDLTVALEETSLLGARVGRWGQRRRTRSTGNLPSAPQPTEDSSSTDTTAHVQLPIPANVDRLDTKKAASLFMASDDEETEHQTVGLMARLPVGLMLNTASAVAMRMGALESDSLNETFSPARFFKPSSRRKRKLKRMAIGYDISDAHNDEESITQTTIAAFGLSGPVVRKRVLKTDSTVGHCQNPVSNLFFCGKRKRSNRDRYHSSSATDQGRTQSSSMPRHTYPDDYRNMRPRSFSSTMSTKSAQSDRLLPLNKGLLSKIERISQQKRQQEKVESTTMAVGNNAPVDRFVLPQSESGDSGNPLGCPNSVTAAANSIITPSTLKLTPTLTTPAVSVVLLESVIQMADTSVTFHGHRMKATAAISTTGKSSRIRHSRVRRAHQIQNLSSQRQNPMDCELNDFLSSSSLSSSESDDAHANINDTDREGDDELTDWPGNECVIGGNSVLAEPSKRKLTKKNTLSQTKSDESGAHGMYTEDDTLMSAASVGWTSQLESLEPLEMRYQPSEPIAITAKNFGGTEHSNVLFDVQTKGDEHFIADAYSVTKNPYGGGYVTPIPITGKQLESELSGETSTNPFFSSKFNTRYASANLLNVREIRAGCRRLRERPGFSIRTRVNERLSRFLQDGRQLQIRLPDLEIFEHESLINLATLYSLQISFDNGCAVLTKTSNTTQSVNVTCDSNVAVAASVQTHRLLLGDFKRRCYDDDEVIQQ